MYQEKRALHLLKICSNNLQTNDAQLEIPPSPYPLFGRDPRVPPFSGHPSSLSTMPKAHKALSPGGWTAEMHSVWKEILTQRKAERALPPATGRPPPLLLSRYAGNAGLEDHRVSAAHGRPPVQGLTAGNRRKPLECTENSPCKYGRDHRSRIFQQRFLWPLQKEIRLPWPYLW